MKDAVDGFFVTVSGGQNWLPAQDVVIVATTLPDIAELLEATIVKTVTELDLMVAVSAGAWPTSVQVNVTLLPATDPVIELVTMVTGVEPIVTVPEMAVPVCVSTRASVLPAVRQVPVTLSAVGVGVGIGVGVGDGAGHCGVGTGVGHTGGAGFGGGGVSATPTEIPPTAPTKLEPVVPSIATMPISLTVSSPDRRTGLDGSLAVQLPLALSVPLAITLRPFTLDVQVENVTGVLASVTRPPPAAAPNV